MRRIATMVAGAVLALALVGPAVASEKSPDPAPGQDSGQQSGQGEGAHPQASPKPGDGKAHFDKTHHDQPGENNCTKYRDQCQYDPRCDCYYRLSDPPKSGAQAPRDDKAQPTASQDQQQQPSGDQNAGSGPHQGGVPHRHS